MSEMVARQYLVTPRGQIIATTLLARRRRHKFVRAVSRGLLPPETPPSLRKSRKRRLPGLMGMDPADDVSYQVHMQYCNFEISHTFFLLKCLSRNR